MPTTRSDTSENTTTSHKSAVREFLSDHGALTESAHLTVGAPVGKTGAAV